MHFTQPKPDKERLTGSRFFQKAAAWKWKERDSLACEEILSGNLPPFLSTFIRINTSITDSLGNIINARFFVSPDYLSLGTRDDWARIPLTPMSAQKIADSFHCFLPTRKMVNDIYKQANVKLAPVPMFAFRDSTVTMWQHHLIIEGQRRGRKGLIAGIKKDLVITGKLNRESRVDREAIYGWQTLDGKAIQPLYTGHVNWWVDYSHGVRLVYKTVYVNGRPMNYKEVLSDAVLQKLLCDEEFCDCFRYDFPG